MTTIPQVAAGLTKAQRDALLQADSVGGHYLVPIYYRTALRVTKHTLAYLKREGLTDSVALPYLTALGKQVREYLINEGISHG